MSVLEKRMNGLSEDLFSTVSKLIHNASPKAVHRLRTTIRRIESLVDYSNPDLSKKQEKTLEYLSDLRKRAGKVRDIDVQMGLLGQLANGSTVSDRRTLTALLKAKRARQAERLVSTARKMLAGNFLSQMSRIAKRSSVGSVNIDQQIAPLQEAKMQLDTLSSDFSSHPMLKPRRLHEARIKLKMVRYVAEVAEKSEEQERFLNELKSVHKAVGEWHDWAELAKTAEEQFVERANPPILMEIRSLFAAKYAAATSAITQLFTASSFVPPKKQAHSARHVRIAARRAS